MSSSLPTQTELSLFADRKLHLGAVDAVLVPRRTGATVASRVLSSFPYVGSIFSWLRSKNSNGRMNTIGFQKGPRMDPWGTPRDSLSHKCLQEQRRKEISPPWTRASSFNLWKVTSVRLTEVRGARNIRALLWYHSSLFRF